MDDFIHGRPNHAKILDALHLSEVFRDIVIDARLLPANGEDFSFLNLILLLL